MDSLDNTSFYNISVNPMGETNIVTTLTKLWLSLQSSALNSMLYNQIFYLILVILTLELTRDNPVTWKRILDHEIKDKKVIWIKILRTIAWISLPLALYGVFLLISIKMELNL